MKSIIKETNDAVFILLWISVAVVIVSLALSIFNIVIKDNRTLKIVGHVIFGISVVFFVILLILAATVQYKF